MIAIRFPIRPKNFFFVTVSLPNIKSTIFFEIYFPTLFAEVNFQEHDIEHKRSSDSEVKKVWNISLFSLRLLVVVLNYGHSKFFLLKFVVNAQVFLRQTT